MTEKSIFKVEKSCLRCIFFFFKIKFIKFKTIHTLGKTNLIIEEPYLHKIPINLTDGRMPSQLSCVNITSFSLFPSLCNHPEQEKGKKGGAN